MTDGIVEIGDVFSYVETKVDVRDVLVGESCFGQHSIELLLFANSVLCARTHTTTVPMIYKAVLLAK